MTTFGVDYAFRPWPSISAMRSAGVKFVMRYISSYAPNDTNGKNLTPAEFKALRAAGFLIGVVAEEGSSRMLDGYAAGVADAQHADAVVKALGMAGLPIYFACDWDASEAQQTLINSYLDGAASVIGRKRTGIYGGYYPLKRALDAGKAAYGWQTYAWSGGQWDARAQLRQYRNDMMLGGGSCDYDQAQAADYGQFPRPVPPAPAPAPTVVPASWAYTAPRGLTARGGKTSVYLAWQPPAGTVPAFPAGMAPPFPSSYTARVYSAAGKLLTTRTASALNIQIGSLPAGRLHAYVWPNGGPAAPAGTPMVYFDVG